MPHQLMTMKESYLTPPAFGTFVTIAESTKDKEHQRQIPGMIVGFEEHTPAVWIKVRGRNEILPRDTYYEFKDQEAGKQAYIDFFPDDR